MPRTAVFLLVVASLAAALPVAAKNPASHYIFFENDVFTGSDQHYTNGVRYMRIRLAEEDRVEEVPRWGRWLAGRFELCAEAFDPDACFTVSKGWAITQNMYTPRDITEPNLIVNDRPYGGWLHYTSIFDLTDDESQHHFEASVGLVGEWAGAEAAQKGIHELIDSDRPEGWEHQLDNEPALLLRYQWSRRLAEASSGGLRLFDLTSHVGAAAGNVFTYAGAGITARLGYNLSRSFPAGTIPSVAAGGAVETGDIEFYLLLDVEGRGVARNIFLDGNTFSDSHSVDKEPFVWELVAGFAVRYKRWTLTYRNVTRSPEFELLDLDQHYGSVALTIDPRG